VLLGRIWDASLSYSQVEKEFKQDVMAEEGRFRNAKLSFYRGDFDLAQKQLNILKSGTSNLIANDAIDLSVLITENVEDSNTAPLQRFAYADLLLFQNKDKEAEALIDSIAQAVPKHPLADDIVMMHATLAIKHRDFPRALAYLKEVMDKYGKDVLADDALFKTAQIYYEELHQTEEAKKYYEQLIIDYPGSTYVQTARQKLADITAQSTQ
jgi:TolA-binding protein